MDALGHTVRMLNYDARNQVTQRTDALNHSDTYQYDILGRLIESNDPLSNATQYDYDSLDRLMQSIDALSGESGQGFYEDGNRATLTDPNGNQTRFTFDLSGRLIESRTAAPSTSSGTGPVQYTYNARD